MHLIFNMYALYSFRGNRFKFNTYYDMLSSTEKGKLLYLMMYVTSFGFCLLPTYIKHKEDIHTVALALQALYRQSFLRMLLDPDQVSGFIFIPGVNIPGFIFGFLFLIVSSYLDKRGGGNINHSAHIWGAIYGIAFVIALSGYILFIDHRKFYLNS